MLDWQLQASTRRHLLCHLHTPQLSRPTTLPLNFMMVPPPDSDVSLGLGLPYTCSTRQPLSPLPSRLELSTARVRSNTRGLQAGMEGGGRTRGGRQAGGM